MKMKVYHAHIKLDFQMSLMDYCKTMNRPINLRDLSLLSCGRNSATQKANPANRVEDKVGIVAVSLV